MNSLSDKEAAQHLLLQLREEVGGFPDRLTPKYPLPSIMQTERQISVMMSFARESACDEVCMGVKPGELDQLVSKGRLLRARYLLRQWRRGEVTEAQRIQLINLVDEFGQQHIGVRPGEIEKISGQSVVQ